jgi:hypothetical protein
MDFDVPERTTQRLAELDEFIPREIGFSRGRK